MYVIREARWLAPQVRWIRVEAPRIAVKHRPGHFVIVRVAEEGERIPLTVASADRQTGTIVLVVQAVGATTMRLSRLKPGEGILNIAGPLGLPTEIRRFGHVVLVGGGVGTAVILPQAEGFKAAGNRVTAVIGARSRPLVILEEELARFCDAVFPCTDDGSYGYHGLVTGRLAELIDRAAPPVDAVLAAGPVPMMKAVAETTRPHRIHTVASLNPIMVDGTGMCGGCRVMVGGRMMFACCDGPEFDAHQVDFDELRDRLTAYRAEERTAVELVRAREPEHTCKLAALEVRG